VLKYQLIDTIHEQDLAGVINKWLGDAGYGTSNTAYYQRIYEAKKAGDTQRAEEMEEYLTLGKGVQESTLSSGIKSAAKQDETATAAETAQFLTEEGMDATDYIRQQIKKGNMTGEDARKWLQEQDPDKSEDSIWWTVDRAEYYAETGKNAGSGTYYRLWDAMDANKADAIGTALDGMTAHGVKKDNIVSQLKSHYKEAYLAADSDGKRRIRDAMQKAYRKLGFTAEDADKVINGWK